MWGYVRSYIRRCSSMFESVGMRTFTAIHACMIALLTGLKYKVECNMAKSTGRCAVYSYMYVRASYIVTCV